MSDANDSGKITRLAIQRTQYRDAARKAIRENKAALQKIAELEGQLDGLKKADSSGRVAELEGQLRTLKHRSAFDRAAKLAGVKEEDLDDLFSLSGYRAEGEEPDAKTIGRLIDDAKAHPSRKRYFAEAEGEGQAEGAAEGQGDAKPAQAPARKEPPPDAGRGKRGDGKGTVYLTREQLADPKFMLDPRNRDLIKGAKVKG